jgi:hypothetical protein
MELTSAGDETSCRVGQEILQRIFQDCSMTAEDRSVSGQEKRQEQRHDKPKSAGILSHPT